MILDNLPLECSQTSLQNDRYHRLRPCHCILVHPHIMASTNSQQEARRSKPGKRVESKYVIPIGDTFLTTEEQGYRDTLQEEKYWRNDSILGVAFTNITTRYRRGVRDRIRSDYIHNWQRYANVKFEFDCPSSNADIRIQIHRHDLNSAVGTDSRLCISDPSMSLTVRCGPGDVLHGKIKSSLGIAFNMNINAVSPSLSDLSLLPLISSSRRETAGTKV